jgi:GNAT superfamily N-acetyltransferase
MVIGDLGEHLVWLPTLARWHFDQWGPLTGATTLEGYVALLTVAARRRTVPSVLVAVDGEELLGSANLVAADLPPRPELTPWLAQLFVAPARRRAGVAPALVRAVLERARGCGFGRVYLYTSGTLPQYYARLGWSLVELIAYLDQERTVMHHDLQASVPWSSERIERLTELPPGGLDHLIVDSARARVTFVRRLADEWRSGANRFDRPGEALLAAWRDGRPVAVCGLNVDPYAGDWSIGRVRHLYVLSGYRRLGIGQRLVGRVIEAARGRFARLHLRTTNPGAARLYEQLGFRRSAGRSDCSHVMELPGPS